jgi:hypothetical protein
VAAAAASFASSLRGGERGLMRCCWVHVMEILPARCRKASQLIAPRAIIARGSEGGEEPLQIASTGWGTGHVRQANHFQYWIRGVSSSACCWATSVMSPKSLAQVKPRGTIFPELRYDSQKWGPSAAVP